MVERPAARPHPNSRYTRLNFVRYGAGRGTHPQHDRLEGIARNSAAAAGAVLINQTNKQASRIIELNGGVGGQSERRVKAKNTKVARYVQEK